MNEEQLFLAALDLPDETARGTYLDETCGADAGLRQNVEALLAAHFQSGEFLDVPAAEQVSVEPGLSHAVTIASEVMSAHQDPSDVSESLEFLAPPTRPDSLGRIDHYEILQVLGTGGFGIVFRAFDDVLQRVVAIKVMSPQMAATSPARKRFLREARSSAQVRHENVVQVYEVGEQPLPYLVMEFIPGETLQQRLDRVGPLDVAETLRIGRQIAEGLAAAHAMDLIHRDIKPGNVLLEGGQQKVKITDFGLARTADDASVTQSGQIAGTPMYMAPEQALGETLDQRADLFSLGSVLYQMVAGRPPFRANSAVAVLKRVAEDTPRNIREVIPETPQWLCDIIAKLHAKNPEERYQSAREVADVLADCEAQLTVNSKLKDYSRIPRTRTASLGKWRWVMAVAALLLPLIALAVTESVGVTHLFHRPTPFPMGTLALRCEDATLDLTLVSSATGRRSHYQSGDDAMFSAGIATLRLPAGHYTLTARKNGNLLHEETFFLPAEKSTPIVVPTKLATPVATSEPGWVQLFNGKDLDGWDKSEQWKVIDHVLTGSAQDGQHYMLSRHGPFANLHLRADVRLQGSGSGTLVFRASDTHLYGLHLSAKHTGLSVQPPFKWLAGKQHDLVTPEGWFKLELIADGSQLTSKVNGQVVATVTDNSSPRGIFHLGLNALDGPVVVQLRKIEIKELPSSVSSSVAPSLAVAPFDAAQAKAHQDAWARHLGVEPEITNSIGMKLRLIPPGRNELGASGTGESGDAFFLGATEVTIDQFRRFVEDTRYTTVGEANKLGGMFVRAGQKTERDANHIWSHPAFAPSGDHPVALITWHDAMVFCDWLSKQEGRTYRLSTITEWRWAEHAGSAARFYFGDNASNIDAHAWTVGNSGMQTHTVAAKEPNPWGLFDMNGNVWELSYDWLRDGQPVDLALAKGGPYSHDRILFLGGGYSALSDGVGSSASGPSTIGYSHLGFRVAIVGDLKAKTPPPAAAKQEPLPPTYTNSIGMEFVIVPKGKSWLGGGQDKPADQEVEFPADFYLGKYEVTQEEWEKVMRENGSWFSRTGEGMDAVTETPDADLKRFPVELVSWDQSQIFVEKLNQLEKETDWVYRLPTQVEWEHACRGGGGRPTDEYAFDYYVGQPTNTLLPDQANFTFGENALNRTCKVGSYQPNRLGLHDMHGNVWEWCQDEVQDQGFSKRPTRGGGWEFDSSAGRAWFRRSPHPPAHRHNTMGLRLARVPVSADSPAEKLSDADAQRIAALPATQQVEEVRKVLMRLNPAFDGKLEHKIEGNVVTELHVNTDEVEDLAPVRALTGLVYLDCRGTYPNKGKLSDLSPLKGMTISRIDCSSTQVGNLTPLSGLPLTYLHFNHNPVDDLTPLKGMPLEELGLAETKVSDLSPLKGMQLRILGAQLLPVTDLSPLQGMPLTGLDLYHTIGVTSLEPLRGMPLDGLNLQDVSVSDLSPLKGMDSLRTLLLQGTSVSDLTPLQGLKLTDLLLMDKQITDLSPLKGMPLIRLHIFGTGVSDLTPLQGMPLQEIRLTPQNITQGLDILREIKSLKTIGTGGNQTWPPAEFWERLDKGEFK